MKKLLMSLLSLIVFTSSGCNSYASTKKLMSNCSIYVEDDSFTYTTEKIEPEIYVVDEDGEELILDEDYKVTYKSNKNAGTGKITVKGKGSYSGSKSTSFTIKRRNINETTGKLLTTRYVYNGKDKRPKVALIYNNLSLNSKNYSISYSNNTSVGKAKAIIEGRNNFKNKVYYYFVITPSQVKNLTVTQSSSKYTLHYDKIPGVTGYEIDINGDLTYIKSNKTNYSFNSTETPLSVKVRGYVIIDDLYYYGPFSKVKTILK